MQGSELKAAREQAGMTQGQFADALGLSGTFIGLMERGEKAIELRTELAVRYLLNSKAGEPGHSMRFGVDQKGQHYIEWNRATNGIPGYARAWIAHRTGGKDWAGTGRYLNTARVDEPGGGPRGNGTDFPIYSELGDLDILRTFVVSVSALAGNALLVDPSG